MNDIAGAPTVALATSATPSPGRTITAANQPSNSASVVATSK